ncbi:MAG: hypothetical protein NTY14_01755 [Candidatus Omnitrophica bacterium]|nr:hypothetical protein [Candidatus Omnitrophota bacterium]
MKKVFLFLPILVLSLLIATSVFAQITTVNKPITASASVTGSTAFTVNIYKSLTSTTFNWNTDYVSVMNFGTLTNAVVGDPTSALNASNFFMALVTVTNNTGTAYHVSYTGAPLIHTDATTRLSNDAWTVMGGLQYNSDGSTATVYSTGLSTTRRSAGLTTAYNVYNSNTAGISDTFRVYFAITGDPTLAVGTTPVLIPPTQKAGSYSGVVTLSLIP